MNARTLLTGFFVFAGLLGTISPAFSQQSPPESEKAKQIVALVDEAAALINSKGKSVFPEFRKSGSEWLSGDTYLFVADNDGNSLLNAGFPKLEVTNEKGLKDANGKLITVALIEAAQSKGSGWVDYMWPKPGEKTPSLKITYIKRAQYQNQTYMVGSGVYI